MTSNDPGRPVAIVTGASSGIGRETALALAGRGYRVVLAARRTERLEQLAGLCCKAGGAGEPWTADLAHEQQVLNLVGGTADRWGRLDVLVNNAGFGLFAPIQDISTDGMREIFEVNYFAVFFACREAAPIMIGQGGGHIFNVSSVIGKRGTPYHGAYCATKFAMMGLTDALRVELAPHSVRVTAVCPALTDTEFHSRTETGRKAESTLRYLKGGTMDPAVVGRKIAATVGKSTPELVFTLGGKLLTLAAALSPRLADAMMGVYRRHLEQALEEQDRSA